MKELALETFKNMDTDNSGHVSFSEFKVAMQKQGEAKLSFQALKDFFCTFDKDHDGQRASLKSRASFCDPMMSVIFKTHSLVVNYH